MLKQKQQKVKIVSPFRSEKIIEGRAKFKTMNEFKTEDGKAFEFFNGVNSVDDGFSRNELCAIRYPELMKKNKKGKLVPTLEASKLITFWLYHFNRSKKNSVLEIYAFPKEKEIVENKFGEKVKIVEMIYHAIPKLKDYTKKVKPRMDRCKEGYDRTEERITDKVSKTVKEKEVLNAMTEERFRKEEVKKQLRRGSISRKKKGNEPYK